MDQKQFIQLYDTYFDDVWNFLSYYTKDKYELEELVQDVFVRLWKYRDNIDLTNNYLRGYLLKTSRNVALSKFGKKSKEPIFINSEFETIEAADQESVAVLTNLRKDYEKALTKAPDKARKVYLMNREQGYTYSEIAESLQISPKTVEVHISKVLRVLRKQLSEYQY